MRNGNDPRKTPDPARARRTFLVGLLTGGGALAALAGARGGAATARPGEKAPPGPASTDPTAPILYRRTAEVERYYRTLYS